MSSPVPYVGTHQADAVARIVEQLKESPLFLGAIQVLGDRAQSIEDDLYDLANKRDLDTAENAQLDGIGELVGEPRGGRSDTDYRAAIKLKIFINSSEGDPETIIQAVADITDSVIVVLLEVYPAAVWIYFDGATIPENIQELIQLALPAGVNLGLVSGYGNAGLPLSFSVIDALGATVIEDTTGGKLAAGATYGWDTDAADQLITQDTDRYVFRIYPIAADAGYLPGAIQ